MELTPSFASMKEVLLLEELVEPKLAGTLDRIPCQGWHGVRLSQCQLDAARGHQFALCLPRAQHHAGGRGRYRGAGPAGRHTRLRRTTSSISRAATSSARSISCPKNAVAYPWRLNQEYVVDRKRMAYRPDRRRHPWRWRRAGANARHDGEMLEAAE